MWGRILEFTLGIWLAISWIIFGYKNLTLLLWNDFLCFILITLFSLLSYVEKLRHLHILNFFLGIWLIILSYMIRADFEVNAQNYMTLAILLLMLSIIPSHANRPPYQWIKFMLKNPLSKSKGQKSHEK